MIDNFFKIEEKPNIKDMSNIFKDIKGDNDILIHNLNKNNKSFLCNDSIEFSNFSSAKSAYDMLNEESCELSLNLFGNNIIDIEKEDTQNVYEIRYNENINKSNKKFVKRKTFKVYKNIIFNIEKVLKLGRIKKGSNKKGKHDKFQKDNIIRRFKVFLMKNIFNYINKSFNHDNKNTTIIGLKTISSMQTKSISKRDNILWLNSKIKDIFNQNLTSKIITFDINYNKNLIKRIYEEQKEEKVINILDKTVKELWKIYINDDLNNNFIGFETIKHDIAKLRKMGESEEYIELFINCAKRFEDIFNEINPRKTNIKIRKKKIN